MTGGIHGSNRLGGNATADVITFGRIAAGRSRAGNARLARRLLLFRGARLGREMKRAEIDGFPACAISNGSQVETSRPQILGTASDKSTVFNVFRGVFAGDPP